MTEAGAPLAEAVDVTKWYGTGESRVVAVDSVTVSVAAGSVTALVGRSGSGKSTLLNILAGLETPSSGTARLLGRELTLLPEAELTELRRHAVGVVFQAFHLMHSLRAWENVAVPLVVAGSTFGKAKDAALARLDAVGLAHRAEHRPGELSGGEQQRVAVARALVADAPVIVADEPTANLDSAAADGVLTLLQGLATEQRAVVLATHDPAAVEIATDVMHLVDGRATVREGAR